MDAISYETVDLMVPFAVVFLSAVFAIIGYLVKRAFADLGSKFNHLIKSLGDLKEEMHDWQIGVQKSLADSDMKVEHLRIETLKEFATKDDLDKLESNLRRDCECHA